MNISQKQGTYIMVGWLAVLSIGIYAYVQNQKKKEASAAGAPAATPAIAATN